MDLEEIYLIIDILVLNKCFVLLNVTFVLYYLWVNYKDIFVVRCSVSYVIMAFRM